MLTLKFLPQQVEARQFCRIWFGIADMSLDFIADYETQQGYRKECVALLSTITGLSIRTVRSWGAGIRFQRMPACYRLTLAYALKAAEIEKKKQVA